MILPIVAYGTAVLRNKAKKIEADYPNLKEFLTNLRETMENSDGVGIAAPQVGKSIRVFLVDTSAFAESDELSEEERHVLKSFKKTFINPELIEELGEEWIFSEGCLSIPEVRQDISRKEKITLRYVDENFKEHQETFSGIAARVVQHEYDHLEGILFTDKISSFKKRLIKKKLENIQQGKISTSYKMTFAKNKR